MLNTVILISAVSAFLILLMGKTGLRDIAIQRSPRLVSRLFECDFCLSFWTSVLVSLAVSIVTGDPAHMAAPVFTAPITRILI